MAGSYVIEFDWAPPAAATAITVGHWRDDDKGRARLDRLANSLAVALQVRPFSADLCLI